MEVALGSTAKGPVSERESHTLLLQEEIEIPVRGLLTHECELKLAGKIGLCLARLQRLFPWHPNGYRRFLARMREVSNGQRTFLLWRPLKKRMGSELPRATKALERAEALAASQPEASLASLKEGVEIILEYPLYPEELYEWVHRVVRSSSALGPLNVLKRTQKVTRALNRLLRALENARDRLVISNLRLVLAEVFRFRARGMNQTDLFQEGFIGLHKAAFRFNPALKCRFSTYATYWIRQSIRKALADKSALIRVPQTAQQKLRHGTGRLSAEGIAQIRRCLSDPTFLHSFGTGEDSTFEVEDRRSSGATEVLHIETIPEVVRNALLRLKEFEREIVERRFGLGGRRRETLEEIASQVQLSRERVRQIEEGAVEKLRLYRDLQETYEDLASAGMATSLPRSQQSSS